MQSRRHSRRRKFCGSKCLNIQKIMKIYLKLNCDFLARILSIKNIFSKFWISQIFLEICLAGILKYFWLEPKSPQVSWSEEFIRGSAGRGRSVFPICMQVSFQSRHKQFPYHSNCMQFSHQSNWKQLPFQNYTWVNWNILLEWIWIYWSIVWSSSSSTWDRLPAGLIGATE